MADKVFPVELEKDGVKRVARSAVAYNQFKTQGFVESSSKPARESRDTRESAPKPAEPKTEAKAPKAKAEDK